MTIGQKQSNLSCQFSDVGVRAREVPESELDDGRDSVELSLTRAVEAELGREISDHRIQDHQTTERVLPRFSVRLPA